MILLFMLCWLKKGISFVISLLIILEESKVQFNRNFYFVFGIVLYDLEMSDVLSVFLSSVLGVLLKKFFEDVNIFVWLFEGKVKYIFFI